jgi:hypothetical protein
MASRSPVGSSCLGSTESGGDSAWWGGGAAHSGRGAAAGAVAGSHVSSGGHGSDSGRARRGARAGMHRVGIPVRGKNREPAGGEGAPAGGSWVVTVTQGRPVVASGRPAGARRAAKGAAAAPVALEVSTGAVPGGGRRAAVVARRASVEDAFAARARLANGPQTFPLAARVSRECSEWHESDGWHCSGAAVLTCHSPCHGDAGSGRELAAEARDRDRWCFRAVSEPWIHGTEVTRWNHYRNERRWRSDGGSWRRTQC